MIPDKAAAVLRDYRSGKAKSAGELAKLHGVSRSAVYRLIAKEPQQKSSITDVTKEQPRRPARETEDEPAPHNTFHYIDMLTDKAEQFANALGLPDDSGKISHVEPKDERQQEEDDQKLDMMMNAMLGGAPEDVEIQLPKGLQSMLDEPTPQRRRANAVIPEEGTVVAPPQRYGFTEAKRAEITQKIIFNVQHFGQQLEIITGSNKELFIQSMATLSPQQLKDTLTTLERTRSVGNIAAGFKQVFYVAAQATEVSTQFIGMRSEGFAQQLKQQDEEISMIMKELAIEQWERLKAMDSPQARLGLLFCATLVQTDTRNRLSDHLKQAHHVPAAMMTATSDL